MEVYNLAADMGGMGFIERFRVECLRSILINTHMIEAAYRAGARRYFFSSLRLRLQHPAAAGPERPRAQGIRRLPGDGRARLRLGEADSRNVLPGILGRARHEDRHRPLPQRLWPARHLGRRTRKGPRRHLPQGHRGHRHRQDLHITIWGDGHQTRSFMYIDDCVKGIDMIMHCDELIATPINLGSSELVSINDLVTKVEKIAGVKLKRELRPDRAAGRGRPQQRQHLHQEGAQVGAEHHRSTRAWPPPTSGSRSQYENRKKGKRVGIELSLHTQDRHEGHRSASIAECIGRIPNRLQLAGGWIDQPFVSRHNPKPPGSMVVVQIEPNFRPMDRSGIASGTRAIAMKLWKGRLPKRPPGRTGPRALRGREPGQGRAQRFAGHDRPDLSGHQPARLRFRGQRRRVPGAHRIAQQPRVARWLEKVLHLLPVEPRPEGYNPLGEKNLDPKWIARLGQTGKDCFEAIRRMDVDALGASLNDCMKCWETLLPHTVRHPHDHSRT